MAVARFLLLEVVCLLALVAGTNQCEWTSCQDKLTAFLGCPSGKTESQRKDCGTEVCVKFIGCSYTHTTRLCCDTGNACAWYDFSCNGASLADFFDNATDTLNAEWKDLSDDLKSKLTTAEQFKTLTAAQLKNLSKDVLAEVKSVAGMSSSQLKEVSDQVKSFDLNQFQAFMKKVAPSSVADTVASLVGSCSDGEAGRADILRSVLESPSAWGDESSWSAANISALGCMLGNFSTDTLAKMADDALAAAGNLQNLGSTQLGALTDKLSKMKSANFAQILKGINKSEMQASIKTWGKSVQAWGFEKVEMIRTELVKNGAWGPVQNWTAMQLSDLGSLITFLNASDIMALADEALVLAKNLGNLSADQIMTLGNKIGNMALQNLSSVLSEVDPKQLHMAMLSSCDITCQSDADMAFLKDPSLTTATAAIEQSAQKISSRSAAAAEAFASSICNASLVDSVSQASADLKAATSVCNGSAKRTGSSFLSSWSKAQKSELMSRLMDMDAFGAVDTWTEPMLSSMCDAFAGLTPENVAKLAAKQLIKSQLPNYQLAMAAGDLPPSVRNAVMPKLKEGLGAVETWTCDQVAGARELIAGMLPEDLSKLSVSAVRGLLPDAFSAMSAEQVAALGAEHFKNISQQARNRLSASRLIALDGSKDKLRAVVCGAASTVGSDCPPIAVDVVMSVANMSDAILAILRRQFESIDGVTAVQILSALAASELPVMSETSRRLKAGGLASNAMVTMRALYSNATSSASAAIEKTKAAAVQAATMCDGVVQDVVGIDLDLASLT
eukprot:TRINITY_DN2807_c0_g2_i1.p1 TRINITY_DN2807_c0_g2~~TRINITY_DN2807_c0_g2_i1.p1  ORF type:complete len:794 (-),score=210.39 TRINITY_DN2807_c0_g2_i1:107-2467(-)